MWYRVNLEFGTLHSFSDDNPNLPLLPERWYPERGYFRTIAAAKEYAIKYYNDEKLRALKRLEVMDVKIEDVMKIRKPKYHNQG